MTSNRSFRLLEGVDAKIRRARVHLDVLETETGKVYADPHSGRFQEWDDGRAVLIVDFKASPDLCAVAGDAIQNMRSALDHLIWDIVISQAIEPPGKHNSFPIYMHPNEFSVRAVNGTSKNLPQLHGISPDSAVFGLIESEQPYNSSDGNHHWLALLAKFSNHDKHRSIYSFGNIPGDTREIESVLGWNPDAILLDQRVIPDVGYIEGPTEVLWLTFDPKGPPPKVHMDGQFSVVPMFGDEETIISHGVLAKWHKWLIDYIDKFRHLF